MLRRVVVSPSTMNQNERAHLDALEHDSLASNAAIRAQAQRLQHQVLHAPRNVPGDKPSVLPVVQLWALSSVPGLVLMLMGTSSFGAMFTGAVGCVIGGFWAQVSPFKEKWLRHLPSFLGLALLINGILSLVVPVWALLLLSIAILPFTIPHLKDLA